MLIVIAKFTAWFNKITEASYLAWSKHQTDQF